MPSDLEDQIRESAKQPSKASGDAGSVEQQPLPDQIAADRYLAAKKAAKAKNAAIRIVKLVPPGAD